MTGTTGLFEHYRSPTVDEAVDDAGTVRSGYGPVVPALEELGGVGLAAAVGEMGRERRARGVVFGTFVDGELVEHPFPLDPLPRLVPAAEWAQLARGVEQRTRALNAFLADAYRPAGRRRGDAGADRPEAVRAGVLPEWLVTRSPGYRPGAASLAGPGQARVAVAGMDLLRAADGWVVLEDNLRVPSGLGYAIVNRDSARAALPGLFDGVPGLAEPHDAVAVLRAALADAAPPACAGTPRLALLTDGPVNTAWFEHRLLAEAMGIPIATPDTLWPAPTAGSRWPWTAIGCRSTCCTGASTRTTWPRTSTRSAPRWTCCWARRCGPAGWRWPTCRATASPTTRPPTATCRR